MEILPAVRTDNSSQGTVLRSDDEEAGKLDTLVALAGRPAGVLLR